VSAGPHLHSRAKAGTKNETDSDIFFVITKRGEKFILTLEPKISLISFSRGSGPPFKGGLEPLQEEIKEILGSKNEEQFSNPLGWT